MALLPSPLGTCYHFLTMEKQATRGSAQHSEASLLGLKYRNSLELAKRVEMGLAYSSFEKVSRTTGLPIESLRMAVGISPRTLSRRRVEKKLSPAESDRLVSVSRLLSLSIDLFEGDIPGAIRWFTRPNRALGRITPLEASTTEVGAREVENLIGRLEHGVFS